MEYRLYRVEGRRPVGRPRKTWLGSVEADMTELEIDKEGRPVIKTLLQYSSWRGNEGQVHPYQKPDYEPMMLILLTLAD